MIGIYKITNPIGLIYIGASKNVELRIKSGYCNSVGKRLRPINISILEYGFENHIVEIIEECALDKLNERERYWQEHFNSLHPNGLNMNYVSCEGKRQIASSTVKEKIRLSKIGLTPWNKGLPTWESTKKTIKDGYSPLQRKSSKIILDTTTGVYFYCLREASIAYGIPKQTLRCNLSAPNKDASKNKTNLIYT